MNEKEDNRKLNKILNFEEINNIMRAYIKDEKIFKTKENNAKENKIYLINFETYKDNSKFKKLPKNVFKDYKEDFTNLLDDKIRVRESSQKKNLKLKKNKKLIGRKRKRTE